MIKSLRPMKRRISRSLPEWLRFLMRRGMKKSDLEYLVDALHHDGREVEARRLARKYKILYDIRKGRLVSDK